MVIMAEFARGLHHEPGRVPKPLGRTDVMPMGALGAILNPDRGARRQGRPPDALDVFGAGAGEAEKFGLVESHAREGEARFFIAAIEFLVTLHAQKPVPG